MCKRVFILMSLLLSIAVDLAAQTTYDYVTEFEGVDITNVSIQHRAPKWTALHKQQYGGDAPDTYDEDDMFPVEKYAGSEPPMLQAANTYVDTIYMYKGSSTTLVLLNSTNGVNTQNALYYYQRWFDYRCDGNYHISDNGETLGGVSGVTDLLTPNSATLSGNLYTPYRFANGYVQNGATGQHEARSLWKMDFYYPTDAEAASWKSVDDTSWDNTYYIVACDASLYTDFGSGAVGATTTDALSATSDYYEPTLTARSVFYIIGIDGTETAADEAPIADFSHYWHLLDAEYQGGGDKGKYVDEYDLVYPSRRLSNFTEEMVALSKDAQAYAIPGVSANDDDGFVTATIYSDNAFELLRTTTTASAVTLENNEDTIHLSGTNRKISFRLKQASAISGDSKGHCGAPWKVNDKDSIAICVTKTIGGTTYNLARYKITFRDYATPLTQTQLDKVKPDNESSIDESWWWKDMTYRTPQYMQDNYDLLTQLTFDYGDATAATVFGSDSGSEYYYPFPKGWSTCSFGFYDGEKDVKGHNDAGTNSPVQAAYTRYGMYCITNGYVAYWENHGTNSSYNTIRPQDGLTKDAGGNWMYVDASDQPAELVELNFEENLCVGSEVIGTAWIKNGGRDYADSFDSAIMFSIVGVSVDDDGRETHTTLYSQCSGQIRTTTYLNTAEGYYSPDESGLSSEVTGKGSNTNEWFQLYFSFINTSEANYDHYTIRVDNFCASTNGGDYYFDEVKLYVQHPTVDVAQIAPICTDSSEQALTCIDIDYEAIMSRIGYVWEEYLGTSTFDYDENNPTDPADSELALLDYVVINEYAYERYLSEHADEYDDEIALKAAAITASLVTFGNETLGEEEGVTNRFNFPTCRFFLDYNANRQYNMDARGSNLPVYNRYASDDVRYFYVREENDVKYICSDMYSDMQAFTPYLFIVLPYTISDDRYSDVDEDEYKAREFAQYIDDACTITARFSLTSTTVIKVDGMVADPLVDYCAGQVVEISPEVTYTDDNGNLAKIDNVYFDFFFGTTDEYTAENEEYGNVSVHEALLAFRAVYHDAEEIDSWSTPVTTTFTQDHFDILSHYLSVQRTGGKNNQLVLHEHDLSVRVLTSGIALVIQPIEATTYSDDNEIMVCCGYVPIELEAHGDAPSLNTGFSNINYPDNDYVPAIRLGKHHIDASSADIPITINLRDAQYITEYDDSGVVIEIDHLGRVTSTDDLDHLFLIDTDDPDYLSIIDNIDPDTHEYTFTDYDLPIGRIIHLWADNSGTGDTRDDIPDDLKGMSYMQVYFYNSDTDTYTDDNGDSQTEDVVKFTPKEGCYYVVNVHFEEKHGDDAVGTACQGELPVTFKVVPEYVVWNGTEKDNWNNDMHWSRADVDDLNIMSSDGYTSNEDNTTDNGFVPMLFTNVVIPQGGEVELYPAYFAAPSSEEAKKEWTGDEDTDYAADDIDLAEHPTENIMYDMMVYAGELDLMGKQLSSRKKVGLYDNTSYDITSMQTQPYRTNVCNEIHLSSGAQILHSELLLCNRVWTDVALPQNTWTLVSSPLTGIVAGDWYTTSATGSQATLPLFTDITFSSDVNDRYSPAVYQRSWQTAGTIIANGSDDNRSVPAYESTGWTSAYNDASVSYQPGEGYSIKGGYGTESNDSLVFRFPKADEDYTYGSLENNTAKHDQGQLAIFSMVDRDDPDDDYSSTAKGKITVDLSQESSESSTQYYIIGNPFTAYMSMKEFMEKNTQFNAYWLPENGSTGGPVAGNSSDNNSWHMTSDGVSNVYVKPYSAFFVSLDENYDGTGDKYTVTFTPEMQTMAIGDEPTVLQFAIKASSPKGTSSASIAYSDAAANDYALGEDVLLLTDNSWNHSQPMVYSVAGTNAVSVNMIADLYQIPIGVFATDDSDYTLTFVGVDKLDTPSLYDADELTDTPLTEGFTLTLTGSTHGRYFLRSAGAPEGISDITAADDEVTIYSPTPHTLVVTATSEITSIEVYSLNGTALAKATPASLSCTLSALPTGVTLVRTTTTNTTTTKKLYVR